MTTVTESDLKDLKNLINNRFDQLDKRLSNEEVISRTAFVAVVGGMAAGLVKLFFFPGNTL
jgi:hypothetical protein